MVFGFYAYEETNSRTLGSLNKRYAMKFDPFRSGENRDARIPSPKLQVRQQKNIKK